MGNSREQHHIIPVFHDEFHGRLQLVSRCCPPKPLEMQPRLALLYRYQGQSNRDKALLFILGDKRESGWNVLDDLSCERDEFLLGKVRWKQALVQRALPMSIGSPEELPVLFPILSRNGFPP